jgi:HPt (histidine-containing phosphotransfer) domain-containing protein
MHRDAPSFHMTEMPLVSYDDLLHRVGGSEDLLVDVIQLFLEDGPQLLGKIREGLGAGDSRATRAAAHALKGSAANFGAAPVVDVARAIEMAASAGCLDAAADAVPALESGLERLVGELTGILAARSPADGTPPQ